MKALFIASALTLIGSCATKRYSEKIEDIKDSIEIEDSTVVANFSKSITITELRDNLELFTDPSLKGRQTGEPGQRKAGQILKAYYEKEGIPSPLNDHSYFQAIPESYFQDINLNSENVVAFIEGNERPEEVLIISAHYDHLGYHDGSIFYGADDNGSGTAAVMEIAEAFLLASQNNHRPKRSILFLHLTAEEIGLEGSKYYTEHPIFPLDKTIANLNIDMIGRVDPNHVEQPNYIYLIGANRLSKELHYLSEKVNNRFTNLELDYTYNNDDDPNRYYFRSDHYNFAKHQIPVIFYFNGVHDDYHLPSDTPDKINYELLQKRTQLIFATAWQLANRENFLLMNNDL